MTHGVYYLIIVIGVIKTFFNDVYFKEYLDWPSVMA